MGLEDGHRPWALTLSTDLEGGDGVITVGPAHLLVTASYTSLLLASVVSIFIFFCFFIYSMKLLFSCILSFLPKQWSFIENKKIGMNESLVRPILLVRHFSIFFQLADWFMHDHAYY